MEAKLEGRLPSEGSYSKDGGGSQLYADRVQTQEEIAELCETCFGNKESINFEDFAKIVQEKSSEMFLALIILFQTSIPCSENFNRYKNNYMKFLKSDTDE